MGTVIVGAVLAAAVILALVSALRRGTNCGCGYGRDCKGCKHRDNKDKEGLQ